MEVLTPVASLQDLKITFHVSTLVFPSQETTRETIFLSNADMFYDENVLAAQFFKRNPDFLPDQVAKRLKMALEKVLVPYHFMAGRLRLNHESGRKELDCSAAGVGFVVASSQFSLDEIGGGLVHPNLGYEQLAIQNVDTLSSDTDRLLCVVQVTSFRCGGFAIGTSVNHVLFDGLGAKTFSENLASQAFEDKPLAVIPCNNRRLLAARSPPIVAFPHPEFLRLDQSGSSPPVSNDIHEQLELRIFKFSPTKVAQLKHWARNATNPKARVSSFAVVTAVMWRCKAFTDNIECNKDKISTLLNAINIRERVNPPLPLSYSGNAVLPVCVSATHKQLESMPFGELVELISKGAEEMTDEYAKSALDWLEIYGGIPHGNYKVFSWMRFDSDKVVYPWGKSTYSCPLNSTKDTSLIFPDATDGGISAMLALPADQMERFEAHFHKFLPKSRALL